MLNVRTIAQETSFDFSFSLISHQETESTNIRGEEVVRLFDYKKIPPPSARL